MIIKNDKQLIKRINKLLEINEENIAISNLLFSVYTEVYPKDISKVQEYIDKGLEEQDALLAFLYDFLEISDDEEAIEFIKSRLLRNLEKLNDNEYLNNDYAKSINNIGKYKNCSLEYLTYEPYQLFPVNDLFVNEYYEEQPIGYFSKQFKYLALLKNKEIWMSLNPNEIKTMAPYIDKATGNVLVLGLGMGYVAFMMAMKKDVKSVTIIEKDQQVIDIFNNLIWPNFKNKEKIKIIKDDGVNFLRNNKSKYNYIFADLWHSPEDGLSLFIKIKKIDKNIDCWLETSMYALLRRCMLALLFEVGHGFKESNYLKAKIYTDEIVNKFYFATKKLAINSEQDLDNLLDFNNLLSLIINN